MNILYSIEIWLKRVLYSTRFSQISANLLGLGKKPQIMLTIFGHLGLPCHIYRCIMKSPMEILLNPNVAYVVLILGIICVVMAVLIPGTGIPEIAALALLLVSLWAATQLGINFLALVILLIGFVGLLLSLRKPLRLWFLITATLILSVGSAFLYPAKTWYIPSVNPLLALAVSVLAGGFIYLVTRKTVDAQITPPVQDLSRLIGVTGEAMTEIHEEGTVQLLSELWSARSAQVIAAGNPVRVIGREGFTIIVEKI